MRIPHPSTVIDPEVLSPAAFLEIACANLLRIAAIPAELAGKTVAFAVGDERWVVDFTQATVTRSHAAADLALTFGTDTFARALERTLDVEDAMRRVTMVGDHSLLAGLQTLFGAAPPAEAGP